MINRIPLGNVIREVDERNKLSDNFDLLGVSINKTFIKSVANIIGTDLHNYKIIRKNQFACSLMQVSRDGGVAVSLYKHDTPSIMSPAYYVFEIKDDCIMPEYLEMIFNNPEFDREAVFNAVGGVRGTLTWEEFLSMEVKVPDKNTQIKLINEFNGIKAEMQSTLEKRDLLLQLMKAMYQKYIVESLDSFSEPLSKNIVFTNGLAMQNLLPESKNDFYRVLKIRELNQGYCDNDSSHCTISIPKKAIIYNGDLVFSWSATLLIDFWGDETCGLNQHLFKVTSSKYPEWFSFLSVAHHIDIFQQTANDKGTTFGHIKREDLSEAMINVPFDFSKVSKIIQPVCNLYKNNNTKYINLLKAKDLFIRIKL